MCRLGLDMWAAARAGPCRNAHAKRRMRGGGGIEAPKRMQHLVSCRLQRVDPKVHGGARSEASPLLRCLRAEGALEQRIKPLRVIAAHMGRCACRDLALKPGNLAWRKRCRREAAAVGQC